MKAVLLIAWILLSMGCVTLILDYFTDPNGNKVRTFFGPGVFLIAIVAVLAGSVLIVSWR